jgi:hypothetical protein
MIIKADAPIKNLKGVPLKAEGDEVFSVGKALAEILLAAKEGGKMKLFILAQKFYDGGNIELDEADLGLVRKAVKDSEVYSALVLGQLELLLESKKD